MHPLSRHTAVAALLMATTLAAAAPMPATPTPPTLPAAFVSSASQAGMMEVEAAKIAQRTSQNAAVKSFAAKMVMDHQKAQTELTGIAKSKEITVPTTLDAEHTKMVDALRARTGKAFDTAYAMQMVHDHTEAVALFEANVSGPDGELGAFAAKTLPVLKEHQRMADQLNASMAGK